MSTEVTLPALGESVTEGTISRWLKSVGDTVEVDEPLLEVSTDKVDTEIPSPVAGTLLEIRFQEDDVAEVGAVLALVGDESEAGGADAPADDAPAEDAPEPQSEPEPEPKQEQQAAPQQSSGQAQSTEVTLPALGESVTEGTISRWLKSVGETIEVDEPLVEISTDKVDTEVPSPVGGTLLEVRFQEDDVAEVGAVLAIVGDADAAPQASEPEPEPEQQAQPEPEPEPEPEPKPEPKQEQQAAPTPPPARAPQEQKPKVEHSDQVQAAVARRAESSSDAAYVTPLVRKLAAEHDVDLSTVTGTGVGGRIRKQDVLDAAKQAESAPSTPAPAASKAPAAAPSAKAEPSEEARALRGRTEKLSRLRKVIAERMTQSLATAAQLTATVEVDLTAISRIRKAVKDDFKAREGASLSYLPFITAAIVEALKAFPVVNATADFEAGTVTYADSENIGIAVDTPRGLLVPVIKNAGDLNLTGLAKQIGDLGARTREGKVGPDELAGGTFTITNYGSAGTLFDTPIINQPEVAILGTGALVKRPVVVTDQYGGETIAVRDMMYLSLTYDHRLIDGAVAARFLSAVKARLEEGDFGAEFGL